MGSLSDMNDLSRVAGTGAVASVVADAIGEYHGQKESDPERHPADRGEPPAAPKHDRMLAPPRMADEGFVHLVKAIVDVACASSEAHPVAVAANVLAFFCAMIGRGIFQRIGDAVIHCRPFSLIVGKSSKARKGTAEHTVREVFKRADSLLSVWTKSNNRLNVHIGGLSTGEGIGYFVRDAAEADEKGKGGDLGVLDKRLLVIEAEFDNTLAKMRGENSTLSAVVRNLFDGRDIEPMTKTNRTRATKPHVVILGHITGHELKEKSTENDAANGLLNRFLMLYVFRPKLVPLPEPTSEETLDALARKIAEAVSSATAKNVHGNNAIETTLSEAAKRLWIERYPQITRDRDGKGGNLLARSEMYCRMLAMIFAAMDGRHVIEPADFIAAIAWVEYWHASVTYIFNCPDDGDELDPFAIEVLKIIQAQPGIKLSEIQDKWKRKKTTEVNKALERLLNLAPPLVEQLQDKSSPGRAPKKYHALEKR